MPSAWINWPTVEEPHNKYKYASIEWNMSLDQMTWMRQTYSILDWLGDLGGLIEILHYIGSFLVKPIAQFTL